MALKNIGMKPEEIGHVHAHGMSSPRVDSAEAKAINEVFGADKPVVAAKSQMGNLGAGSGAIEIAASLFAIKHGQLFPIMNFNDRGNDVVININSPDSRPGHSFINLNITPHGQASATIFRAV